MRKILAIAVLLAVQAHAQVKLADVGLAASESPTFSGSTPNSATSLRSIQWSHPMGNLVANWSFENSQQFWNPGVAGTVRSTETAKSGYASGAGIRGKSGTGLISERVLLKANQKYTLSYYQVGGWENAPSSAKPRVVYYDVATKSQIKSEDGASHVGTNYNTWKLRTWVLTPPTGVDCYAEITLISGTVPDWYPSLAFDDVMLVEGDATSAALNRDQVMRSISLTDPIGLEMQTAVSSGKDASDIVVSTEYDEFGRKQKEYLPNKTYGWAEVAYPVNVASSWFGSGTTPYTEIAYASANTIGQSQVSKPGDLWKIGGGRTSASGTVLVGAIPTASNQMPNKSFETYVEAAGEKPYVMKWSRDPDNNYAVSWSDVLGRTLASAKLLSKPAGATLPNGWTWAFTSYQYYDNGMLKSVTAPSPASGSVAPVVTSYDFQGRVIATSSPDEGLTRYWYDQAGRLRFWQTQYFANNNWVNWRRYDALGRPVIEGVSSLISGVDVQEMAELPGSEQNWTTNDYVTSATYTKGWIYDKLDADTVSARTYVSLSSISGYSKFAGMVAPGRLVAKYNLNPFYNPTPSGGAALTTSSAKLVMDFYSYDGVGRQKTVGKYIGGITDATLRSHSIEYRYDSAGRVARLMVDKSMSESIKPDATRGLDADYLYTYDDKGRLSKIMDGTLKVAEYTYDDYGRMSRVTLGSQAVTSDFVYNLHNQLYRLTAYTGGLNTPSYMEQMAYESPYFTGVPAPAASYAGRVSQVVHQYGSGDVNVDPEQTSGVQTVKAVNYSYDPAGRMVSAKTYVPSSTGLAQPIAQGTAFKTTPVAALSADYAYEPNDRISSMTWQGKTATTYSYAPGKNQLDQVNGVIKPGDSWAGNKRGPIAYDPDGRQASDASLGRTIVYDAYGLPTSITRLPPTSAQTDAIYPLYDADGQMVTYVKTINNPAQKGVVAKYHYVRIGGFTHKELNETWSTPATTSTYSSVATIVNYRGQSAMVGRKFPGTTAQRQFLIKDHQGSSIRLVNDDGTRAGAFDYYAYGEVRTLAGEATNLTSKYTGKEAFPNMYLQYYGARWYDPQIGTWTGPDPIHQFNSPYSFGQAPIGQIDRDGQCIDGVSTIFCVMAVGAILGGTIKGGVEVYNQVNDHGWNANRWDWGEIGAQFAIGAVAGGVSAGLGYAAGGAALAAGFEAGSISFGSAIALGVGSGFASGSSAAFTDYALDAAFHSKKRFSLNEAIHRAAIGGLSGAALGGLTAGLHYGINMAGEAYVRNKAGGLIKPEDDVWFNFNPRIVRDVSGETRFQWGDVQLEGSRSLADYLKSAQVLFPGMNQDPGLADQLGREIQQGSDDFILMHWGVGATGNPILQGGAIVPIDAANPMRAVFGGSHPGEMFNQITFEKPSAIINQLILEPAFSRYVKDGTGIWLGNSLQTTFSVFF